MVAKIHNDTRGALTQMLYAHWENWLLIHIPCTGHQQQNSPLDFSSSQLPERKQIYGRNRTYTEVELTTYSDSTTLYT